MEREKVRNHLKPLEVEDQITNLIIGNSVLWRVSNHCIPIDTQIIAYSSSEEKTNVVGKYDPKN